MGCVDLVTSIRPLMSTGTHSAQWKCRSSPEVVRHRCGKEVKERGRVSELWRSIKMTLFKRAIHPSVRVGVLAVFSLFSLIKTARHRCSLTGALC